jgi:rfaE bifunctional protein nucleotidyltransferase chain/domain
VENMDSDLGGKIVSIEALASIADALRKQGKKIVHCHGVFDLLHIGHIRYFQQACQMGDCLMVTVTPDRFVDKGPHRPAFQEMLRAEALASLGCVDYVAINEWPTAEETLRLLKPHVYVKGSEFKDTSADATGKIAREAAIAQEVGTTLAFTEDIVFSSSNLINRYLSSFQEEIQEYLQLLRHRYDYRDIIDIVDKMQSLKVLVVGDAIVDEYQYCAAIGMSSKDPCLALKYQSHELFAGGVLAVANHVASFAGHVDLLSVLGARHPYDDFIRSKLNPSISCNFIIKPDGHTVVKRRYLDGYSINKLFEIYVMDDLELPPKQDQEACEWLSEHLSNYDLVLAADFGHRAISMAMQNLIARSEVFLAVMTQANAGNRGFHTITKYPRADYVCLSEHEARLETRDVSGPLKLMINSLGERMGCSKFAVTRGRSGCLMWEKEGRIIEVPSFAQSVVDRIGAGDAFLSLTSMAACQGLDSEIICLLGNIAGSLAVGTVGNAKPVDKPAVNSYITSLLK